LLFVKKTMNRIRHLIGGILTRDVRLTRNSYNLCQGGN
jgi:hypothetical protein